MGKAARAIVDVRTAYSPDQVHCLVTGMALFSPNLLNITLSLVSAPVSIPITFESFRPLLQLCLKYLCLVSHSPLLLTEADAADMGRAWPNMTT